MPQLIPLEKLARGLLRPLSEDHAIDPFAIKAYSKLSGVRIIWTMESRVLQIFAKLSHSSTLSIIRRARPAHVVFERGALIEDTAVTSCQAEVLLNGLASVSPMAGDAVEVGCYRGVTTASLAAMTSKIVYAIDPFIGYGGSERDYEIFLHRTKAAKNIYHVRKPSGAAAKQFENNSMSFVFIDAIHDVSNSWFDFVTWSRKVVAGGLIALHDVDDYPGVAMTCRRILSGGLPFEIWGYCPNLIILRKL